MAEYEKYTYYDICTALFGRNSDACSKGEIHNFIVEYLDKHCPYCSYYNDFDICILFNGYYETIIRNLKEEFKKTYIDTYDILGALHLLDDRGLLTSVAPIVEMAMLIEDSPKIKENTIVVKSNLGDKENTEEFTKISTICEVIEEYVKQKNNAGNIGSLHECGITNLEKQNVAYIDFSYIEKLMRQQCFLKPDDVYHEYLLKHIKRLVERDCSANGRCPRVEKDRLVIYGDSMTKSFEYCKSLANKLLGIIRYDYMSLEDMYYKIQQMPVFAGRFSLLELKDKLKQSSAFYHMGLTEEKIIYGYGKVHEVIYLKKTEFEPFLEDNYSELWEKYLLRRDPWWSAEYLTTRTKYSVETIIDVLGDMIEKNEYKDIVRCEEFSGKKSYSLKPGWFCAFEGYAKKYVNERNKELEYRRKIAEHNTKTTYDRVRDTWLSSDELTRIVNMPVAKIRNILEEMSKKVMYMLMVKYDTKYSGEGCEPFLNPDAIDVFKNYAAMVYKKEVENTIPLEQEIIKKYYKPAPLPEEKVEKSFAKQKKQHSIEPDYKEPFYVNGSGIPFVPNISFLNQDLDAVNPYLDPVALADSYKATVYYTSATYEKTGQTSSGDVKYDSVRGIIRTYLKNILNYYSQKKNKNMPEDKQKRYIRCINNGATTLEQEAEYIKRSFCFDILPFVSKYKNGKIPSLALIQNLMANIQYMPVAVQGVAEPTR